MKRLTSCLAAAALLSSAPALADDGSNGQQPGSPFLKSMSKNLDNKIEGDASAAHAFVDVLNLYVPAQKSDGTVTSAVDHYAYDGTLAETVPEVKPQVGVFLYGPVQNLSHDELIDGEEIGFVGHGKRDAYAAVSLDDGETWKLTNLSESSDKSSIDLGRDPDVDDGDASNDVALFGGDDVDGYPGDVLDVTQASAGNKAIVAWFSRYCGSGQPNYALESSDESNGTDRRGTIASELGIDLSSPSRDDLYLMDMYRVAGQQGSVDYAEDKFDKNHPVKEVPYNCLWTARGTLEAQDDGTYQMVWRKAERLTSGRRDVNRVEVDMVKGAGAVVTWQEDPDGLRPGQGAGPGHGWSGAVANHGTDVWYSFIDWEHFGQVQQEDAEGDSTGEIVELASYTGDSNRPKVGVPMAMPMRMTDNAKCNTENPAPYCNGSALDPAANNDGDPDNDIPNPLDYGMKDMCADVIEVQTGRHDELKPTCVTEDGMPLLGNTAATRPRVGLFGYDSDHDGADDSAWVVFQSEESKGLGKYGVGGCDPEADADCERFDVGKNMWYYTYSMSLFDDRVAEDNGLVANLTSHGNLLNQPAVDYETGQIFPLENTQNLWDFGAYNYDLYRTEIARRGSLLAQDADKVAPGKGNQGPPRKFGTGKPSRLTAFPAWKQGIMRQGGPADVMARRILLPKGYQEGRDNPYAFGNMACDDWAFQDGENPYYPDGVCLEPAVNLSSVTPDTCVDQDTGNETECPTVDPATGIGDTNPELTGGDVEPNTTKVLSWHQCPNDATVVSSSDSIDPVTECVDSLTNRATNINDQSWHNPLDVAKGHRGYIDGDFIMILYAWSPNWKLNAKGKDRYELYVRRSFDGGETWTTTPAMAASGGGSNPNVPDTYSGDGTVSCETFRGLEGADQPKACFEYPAGGGEMQRNVSQLKAMKFTILDPRYSAPKASILDAAGEPVHPEDEKDPSRYFIVYETGDNTTTSEGEAESLDLFYSRAVNFGDDYQVWSEEDYDPVDCYPSNPDGDLDKSDQQAEEEVDEVLVGSGFCNEFDALEGKKDIASGEGDLERTPDGSWLYAVWSQDDEGTGESDAVWRRVWFLDDYNPVVDETYTPATTTTSSSDGSGGGGCALSPGSKTDPVLILLGILAAMSLIRRRAYQR